MIGYPFRAKTIIDRVKLTLYLDSTSKNTLNLSFSKFCVLTHSTKTKNFEIIYFKALI